MSSEKHPSRFALDARALGELDTDVIGHLAACERCRLYLEGLARPTGAPPWLDELRLAGRRSRSLRSARPGRFALFAAVPTLGLAALLFVSVARKPADAPFAGLSSGAEKGGP